MSCILQKSGNKDTTILSHSQVFFDFQLNIINSFSHPTIHYDLYVQASCDSHVHVDKLYSVPCSIYFTIFMHAYHNPVNSAGNSTICLYYAKISALQQNFPTELNAQKFIFSGGVMNGAQSHNLSGQFHIETGQWQVSYRIQREYVHLPQKCVQM